MPIWLSALSRWPHVIRLRAAGPGSSPTCMSSPAFLSFPQCVYQIQQKRRSVVSLNVTSYTHTLIQNQNQWFVLLSHYGKQWLEALAWPKLQNLQPCWFWNGCFKDGDRVCNCAQSAEDLQMTCFVKRAKILLSVFHCYQLKRVNLAIIWDLIVIIQWLTVITKIIDLLLSVWNL